MAARHWIPAVAGMTSLSRMASATFSLLNKAPASMKKLPIEFYARDTALVAKELLGKWLVRRIGREERVGRIVEVEAYVGPHDLACHTARGITPRTQVMHGPPGRAYIYLIYGMYHCMNVVTEPEGHGSAVLIRALEPVKNLDGIACKTRGPGLLCKAMEIDRSLNGYDLQGAALSIVAPDNELRIAIVKRPRIGVAYAGAWAEKALRFYIKDNKFISKK